MPGVIMENGSRNGVHTNHDREQPSKGINGVDPHPQLERPQGKGKPKIEPQQNMTPTSPSLPNGFNGSGQANSQPQSNGTVSEGVARWKDLPPEVLHITDGYVPLSRLLTRQAQKTFVGMTTIIQELSQMPLPSSALNGYNPQTATSDDNSEENIHKKLKLLKFLESTHADWAKQLAITEWSRKANIISKLIDLQQHLRTEKQYYNQSIDILCEYKRALLGATLPNPDLRTALEVLSTGKTSQVSELGYIQPPQMTARQTVDQLEDLNTLLSIRMNLYEHERLPIHFKNYEISSGRVTFKVAGEFEVDLAIASEDPEAQFWFIDLRFTFSPSPADMDPTLRFQIEQKTNEVLFCDGLSGCYRYLHELVLTRKILEIRRQAAELARGRWIEGLKIEQLNRTLSIQYWVDRYVKGPKSWILLGVHSGKSKNTRHDPNSTSRLSVRWFRDGREILDADIPFDTTHLSAEDLLKSVVAKHVDHILSSLRSQLRAKPVFAESENALSLSTSEPSDSVLRIPLTHSLVLSIRLEPISGRFILSPTLPRVAEYEQALNLKSQDPVNDAHTFLETLRCTLLTDEVQRYATSVGWIRTSNPNYSQEALKPHIPKGTLQMAWFTRPGWIKDWHLAITFGMSGEKWCLIQGIDSPQGRKVASQILIPIKSISPVPSYAFMSTINVFVTAILSSYANTRAFHQLRASYISRSGDKPRKGIVLPSIYARLSQLLPSKNKDPRTGKSWAKDIVRITFQGLEPLSPEKPVSTGNGESEQPDEHSLPVRLGPPQYLAVHVVEARMASPLSNSLTTLNEKVDRDIAFHASTGAFAFKLRSRVGEPIVTALIERAVRVERLVDYVQVLKTHEPQLKCESVTLGKISFTYAMKNAAETGNDISERHSQRYAATINFGTVDKIKLILSKNDPHIRVLDLLTRTLNSSQGFSGIAKLLPVTLPALRGLDTIQSTWSTLSALGECFVLVRAAEWYLIRYIVSQPQTGEGSAPQQRTFNFELSLKHRKGKPYWHLKRVDQRVRDGDDLDNALQRVWDAQGKKWLGMRLSGVADPFGIEDLISEVDDVVRSVSSNPRKPSIASGDEPPAASESTAPSVPKPTQRAPSQSQQQRPQMNQRPQGAQRPMANANQNRNNAQAREVVILD